MAAAVTSTPPLHPAKRLIRALSIPLSYPIVPRSSDALTEWELDDLPPSFHRDAQENNRLPGCAPQLRRRATTTTTISPATITTSPHPQDDNKLSWPTASIPRDDIDSSRRPSVDSIFSDASSLSQFSASEERARTRKPTRRRRALRETEADAVWREFWC